MPYFLPAAQMQHRASLERQLQRIDREAGKCCIPGCRRPCQQQAGAGLSASHCGYHTRWRNRTGCYWKGVYSQKELRPYRRAADRWIKENRETEFWVKSALIALRHLMANAGPQHRTADILNFMRPPAKAQAALARLREADIPPERLLSIHLAVTCALLEDPVSPSSGRVVDEYRLCQIAKATQRLASGPASALGKYPRSAGLYLRHLGRLIDGACEHVAEANLAAILAMKISLYGAAPDDHFAHVNAPSAGWFTQGQRAQRR